jgi:hypothetical protein
MRAALRPITDALERDPATGRSVARIEQLARGSGSRVTPVRCTGASEAASAAIPPGTYRTIVTRADAKAHGWPWTKVVEDDPDPRALKSKTREYRLEFTAQGTFVVRDVTIGGLGNIGWEGTYSVYRDRITVQGNEGTKLTARVAVDGDPAALHGRAARPEHPRGADLGLEAVREGRLVG